MGGIKSNKIKEENREIEREERERKIKREFTEESGRALTVPFH